MTHAVVLNSPTWNSLAIALSWLVTKITKNNNLKLCVIVLVSPTHTPYLFACLHELVSCVHVFFFLSNKLTAISTDTFVTVFLTSHQYSDVQGPLRECRSIRPGASGLPYYCAPFVFVSDVIELLTVWRDNKPKTKKNGIFGPWWGNRFCYNTFSKAYLEPFRAGSKHNR